MRKDDASYMDYMRAVPATAIGSSIAGRIVPLLGMAAWSCTAISADGAKGTLSFQFSDFHGSAHMTLPMDQAATFKEGLTLAISGTAGTPVSVQTGRFNDATCSPACMRIVFTPTAGSVGTIYVALTLRAQ